MKNYPDRAAWYDTWAALDHFHRQSRGSSPPPDPIPLEAWPFASDQVKERRWEATVAWAKVHGIEDLLLGSLD